MILKDLFELALTALAFKSFGLFILNVVLCIYAGVSSTQVIYEGWNFNSGNYLFTTDTK